MNRINPKKLLNSKWTAASPVNKEKHFIVCEVEFDEEDLVIACRLEAILSKRSFEINWRDLEKDDCWLHGWK